jgi:DNA modification methylase
LAELTHPGAIVFDLSLGSGSTLFAAQNTGRVCCGVELEPLWVDVVIRRYQASTDIEATHVDSGETFEQIATRSRDDAGQ